MSGSLQRNLYHFGERYKLKEFAMEMTTHEISEQLSRALGDAVIRIWSQLPHDVQCRLFETAISSQGEATRPQLAVFLHEKHQRTSASIRARAMLEPDSLGG